MSIRQWNMSVKQWSMTHHINENYCLSHALKRKWRRLFSSLAKWYRMDRAVQGSNIQIDLWHSANKQMVKTAVRILFFRAKVVSFWSQITIKWNWNNEIEWIKKYIATYKNQSSRKNAYKKGVYNFKMVCVICSRLNKKIAIQRAPDLRGRIDSFTRFFSSVDCCFVLHCRL